MRRISATAYRSVSRAVNFSNAFSGLSFGDVLDWWTTRHL